MARTRNGGAKLWAITATIIAVVAVATLGIFFFQSKLDRYSRLVDFPVDSYLEGRRLWSGEFYRIVGTVDNVLHMNEGGGTYVVSMRIDDSDRVLPVFLTRDESLSTIARSQVLKMQVFVDAKDRIQCLRYAKK